MSALREPEPPFAGAPRYAPQRPFPPYRFVPGLNPHPVSHPQGHSYRGGAREAPPPRFAPERWRENVEFLHGCDLYNHAYWWEAHEAWEGLWHLTRKDGEEGLFLQGLIQIGASSLKRHMGETDGSVKLAQLGVQKLRAVVASAPQRREFMGLDVAAFADAAERCLIRRDPAAEWPRIALAI